MVEFIRDKLINKNPPLRITGRTPLHVAAQRGYLDIIECIFECLWKEDRNPKGQLISECLFYFLNFPKNPTNNLTNFCPRIYKVVKS